MSLEMLRTSVEKGVTSLVSTSHFYAAHESPEDFLRRRRHAIKRLKSGLTDFELPMYFGAEVLYFPGIAQSEAVRSLAIEGTSLILIEMPFDKWTEKIFNELNTFQYNSGLQIVLAHIDRYRAIQSKAIYNLLLEQPFYFQINAEAFSSFSSRRFALQILERGQLHFLGTDCHNTTTRPPNMDVARQVIEKKVSPAAWNILSEEMDERFRHHIL
jgi:protein-tyrosine phosphatase